MELVQSRIVTDDVEGMASFYAKLTQAHVTVNEYYVEVPTGGMSVAFSKRRFTEYREPDGVPTECQERRRGDIILDFVVDDVDAAYRRIDKLDVEWVMPPTTPPWGGRSMIFGDPEGHLINVFSRGESDVTGMEDDA